MNKQLIKKFKKYLKSKSAFYIYLKMYRDCRLSINPASPEDYLSQTKPHLAIPGAFAYPKPEVSIYDRDYWLALHEGWMELLDIDADYTILQCDLVGQNVRMILFRITL